MRENCGPSAGEKTGSRSPEVTAALLGLDALLSQKKPYSLYSRGEGDGHLAPLDWKDPLTVNCTGAVDGFLTEVSGRNAREFRYASELNQPAFFQRTHFYETQWSPHVSQVTGATDVTACLGAELKVRGCAPDLLQEYEFWVRGEDWRAVMRSQLIENASAPVALSPSLRTDLNAFLQGAPASTQLEQVLKKDWILTAPREGGAVGPQVFQSLEALDRNPIRVTRSKLNPRALRECGALAERTLLDSLADKVFEVGLITQASFGGLDREMVTHQGLLVAQEGALWFYHASREATEQLPKGGFRRERWADYLLRKEKTLRGLHFLSIPILKGSRPALMNDK